MTKLPIYFGYAGAAPFIGFMLLSLLLDEPRHAQTLTFIQITYGAMILSFLGGIHWGQGLPSDNMKQLSFAMLPTVSCLVLIIWTTFFDPVLPLIGMAALFWVVYKADKKFMPHDYIPLNYFKFRKKLTIIVSATLGLSALILLL